MKPRAGMSPQSRALTAPLLSPLEPTWQQRDERMPEDSMACQALPHLHPRASGEGKPIPNPVPTKSPSIPGALSLSPPPAGPREPHRAMDRVDPLFHRPSEDPFLPLPHKWPSLLITCSFPPCREGGIIHSLSSVSVVLHMHAGEFTHPPLFQGERWKSGTCSQVGSPFSDVRLLQAMAKFSLYTLSLGFHG